VKVVALVEQLLPLILECLDRGFLGLELAMRRLEILRAHQTSVSA
jgi:hypothetical protein